MKDVVAALVVLYGVRSAGHRFLSRSDVLRAEIELAGDAMLRVRNRGIEAVHILAAFAEASGLLAVIDEHADLLAGVAITIEGGESTRPVEEAMGASSGTPFGILRAGSTQTTL